MSDILTVEAILTAPDLTEETVEVPEWGGSVKIRSFTKARQQQLRDEASVTTIVGGKPVKEIDNTKLELLMFCAGVVEPAFGPEHAAQLAEKSAGAVDRVLKRVLAISGISKEGQEAIDKSGSV